MMSTLSYKHPPRRARATRGVSGSLSIAALGLLLALSGCTTLSGNNATITGMIRISGSTALLPLVQRAARDFSQVHHQVTLDVQGGGSFVGLDQMYGGQVNIGDSDVYADPTRYPDPDITDHLVAVVPFAMVVHPDIRLASLTRDQIIGIYTGRIKNWRDLGGPEEPIKVVSRALTSGTRATFRKYILNGADEVQGVALQKDSSQELVDTVGKTPGAIGYVAVSGVTSAVHVVAIDGVLPTPAKIEQGSYHFWSYEHMYTRGLPTGAVAAFLSFMLTPEEQQVAAALGYISISAMHSTSQSAGSSSAATENALARARKGTGEASLQ